MRGDDVLFQRAGAETQAVVDALEAVGTIPVETAAALFTDRPLDGKHAVDREQWSGLLDRYYALHGWDQEGRPTRQTLVALGLEQAAGVR